MRIDASGRVAAAGPSRSGRVQPWLLVPGLVDAHVHLQLPALPRAPRTFPAWLRAVIANRRQPRLAERAQAQTRVALAELLRSGCTAVGEIDSLGSSPDILRETGIAGRCYQEVLGFDLDARAARALVLQRTRSGTRACPAGLSPHAPYSCSPALLRAARRSGSALTVHVAEVAAEHHLLREGRGELRVLLEDLGKWPHAYQPPGCSAVALLETCGLLGPRTLLAHLQAATHEDLDLVARNGAPAVVCPATIAFFRRTPPDVSGWLRRGITVALGTDSRASSAGELSMPAAMAEARSMWPGLAPATVLTMATRSGGVALGRPGLGRIAVGVRADLCAFGSDPAMAADAALDAATSGELAVVGTWVCGRRVHVGQAGT